MVYDYWHWQNFISETSRRSIVHSFTENNEGKEKETYQHQSKKSDTLVTSLGRLSIINPYLDYCYKTNNEIFGYNVWERNNLDILLLNKYKQSMSYDWHTDAAKDYSHDIKLTVLMNLSDNNSYEGGKFQLWNNEVINIDFKPGDILMFKSGIHHRVTPITSGERISLTHFIMGPRFQ